ncbi:MAG TPA: FAD-dependent oxidoreductase [Rhodospirillaceae bacterium]|nr:FAD-dependent oxidoreductase [Rhodospirillaceae bacterium]MAX63174.1 FAD-dependent oxidoreductase [Rhodospirillaceae bacterium]MAX65129.1 FAD-dependent oxidoreductase [Rhodospirillaceae bacterium]MBB59415.1 FAD-dependent oxidoreductase [Rhodospirillaceae bacterium]HBM14108.1 FAD-dependent oxidoreductase [Rhodospirillaceae bacterium]|tara:strand:- start:2964 stop:4232 length:1269 start_codon:yes stop_codon:yes gene_type:complete
MRGNVWHDTAKEPPITAQAFHGDMKTTVAVVGGGFAGLSAALHLAEAGVDCCLLEAAAFGEGASGRNNGQVIPGLKLGPADLRKRYGDAGETVVETAAGAADLVFDLIEKHAINCEPDRRGWVRAAHSPIAMPAIEKQARQWQDYGAPVDVLDQGQIAELLGSDRYVGGMIDRRAGRLHPLSYCHGLARAAQSKGARLYQNSPVLSLSKNGSDWHIKTAQGTLTAEKVILATGAYSDHLVPGWSKGFMTVHAMQIASAPLSSNILKTVLPGASAMSDTRKLAHAIRLDAEGRIIISGRGPLSGRIDDSVVQQLVRTIGRLFPTVDGQDWTHVWAGRIGITMDELPRLSSPQPGLYGIVGFNGRGVAMATAFGKAAAQHCMDQPAGFPIVDAPKVPFHTLRKPILAAAIAYYRTRDALGLASR